MSPTPTVTYTTPDGVDRALRFTLGARKRIAERFEEPDILKVLNRYGDGALPEIAFAMMYDAQGNPPAKLDVKAFAESLNDGAPLLAAIMAAISKGSTPKNEIEAALRAVMSHRAMDLQTGLFSGLSPSSASDSLSPNSGTAPTESSTLFSSNGETPNESATTGAD